MPDYRCPVFVFDVAVAMLHPVLARPGEVIVVRPGTDEPIVVVQRGTTRVLRKGPPNFGALLGLLEDGVIVQRPPQVNRQAM